MRYTVTCPENTNAREADFTVTIGDQQNRRGELYLRPPVTGQITEKIMPIPSGDGKAPGVQLTVKNNGQQKQDVTWEISLAGQIPLIAGEYKETTDPVTDAHFTETPSGEATLAGGAEQSITVPLAGLDSQTAYRVSATVTDSSERSTTIGRYVAGFVPVPKATGKVSLDGTLDSPDWKKAPVELINEKRQYYTFNPSLASWKGPLDLSGKLQFLWNDKYLYVGVDVTDDIAGGLKQDGDLWQQDSVQFLIDPCRAMNESVGKYDYTMAIGKKGPQAWCNLSADAGALPGDATDIVVSAKRKDNHTGDMTYVLAIPWSRIAPFKPAIGADLGLTMLLNDDDGKGRLSYMMWFGNASSKQVDPVGDLILTP